MDLSDFFDWIKFQLASSNDALVDISIQYLASLLTVEAYRIRFEQSTGLFNTVIALLAKRNISAQMQYQIIYCIWCLSFEPTIVAQYATYFV